MFKKIVLWLWQLPQNVVGFCLTRKPKIVQYYKNVPIYYTKNVFGAGVSLGNYIVLDVNYYTGHVTNSIKHEYGHSRQSLYLGWLYLIVVGLPSVCGNLIDRLFHKSWDIQKRCRWYYGQPWENWADKLGTVQR